MVASVAPQATVESVRNRAGSRAPEVCDSMRGDPRDVRSGAAGLETGVATSDRGLQMLRLLNSLFNGWSGPGSPPRETA